MSDENRMTLPKLPTDRSNWVTYRDCILWMIRQRQWLDHFSSASITPAYTAAGDINGVSPATHWANEESTIMTLIPASVPDHVFNRIKTKTNSFEVWNTIKAIYQTRSKMITVDLSKQLSNTKLGDDEDARAHLTRLQDLQEQLASMGKTNNDDEFASIILRSLPPSFESTINAINAVADTAGTDIMPDRVIQLVTNEYDCCLLRKGKSKNGPEEAFTTNGQKRDRRTVKCCNCKQTGHYKSECWAKGGDKEGQYPPRQEGNTSNNNDRRGNHSDGNNNSNCSNRGRNNRSNNRNDNANLASTDIEAWAAIEEIEEYDSSAPPPALTVYHNPTPQIAYSV